MEKIQSRRNFLKKLGVVTGVSLPLFGWAEGFALLLADGLSPGSEFSLLKLEKLFSGYQYPFINQFSTGSFKSNFTHYNLYGNNATDAGSLILNAVNQGKISEFDFTSTRTAIAGILDKNNTFKYVVSGSVECQNNVMLTPKKWRVSTKIALSEVGEAFANTGIINEGELTNGEIRIITADKTIRKPVTTTTLSWKWGLVAVVQNMSKESLQELQFSLLDEFDAIYENQKLKYRKKVSLDCGKERVIDFKVFELTGDGIIPTVYWVDNMNRTVFVITGMEAYIL